MKKYEEREKEARPTMKNYEKRGKTIDFRRGEKLR